MSTYNATLPCNATSVQSTDPVAWGLISMLITGMCVLYNYAFIFTTMLKMWRPAESKFWPSVLAFKWFDFLLCNVGVFVAAVSVFIWVLVRYVEANQNFSYAATKITILAPQDVANVFYIGISMMVLVYHKLYLITRAFLPGNPTVSKDGRFIYPSGIPKTDALFASMVPVAGLTAICLFGAIYGYQQTYIQTVSICGAPMPAWFPLGPNWPDFYSDVGKAHLATGCILASTLVFGIFLMPLGVGSNKGTEAKDSIRNTVSYQWNVFDVINNPSQKRSVLVGWLPTIHLGFWWTLAFSWYFPQCHMFTHHDLYKTIGVWFCISFLSLVFAAVSGSLDSFTAFFFAAVFSFELIQYVGGTVIYPILTTSAVNPLSQAQIEYGLYLTGPATNANFDTWTVTVFTYIGLALSIMAAASVFLGFGGNLPEQVATRLTAE